jgi:hypothetical protein
VTSTVLKLEAPSSLENVGDDARTMFNYVMRRVRSITCENWVPFTRANITLSYPIRT